MHSSLFAVRTKTMSDLRRSVLDSMYVQMVRRKKNDELGGL